MGNFRLFACSHVISDGEDKERESDLRQSSRQDLLLYETGRTLSSASSQCRERSSAELGRATAAERATQVSVTTFVLW